MKFTESGSEPEFLKTILRLDDVLRHTRFRKAVRLTVAVYHSERIQIKISKGKRQKSEVLEK